MKCIKEKKKRKKKKDESNKISNYRKIIKVIC